jgi:hypothetical protein
MTGVNIIFLSGGRLTLDMLWDLVEGMAQDMRLRHHKTRVGQALVTFVSCIHLLPSTILITSDELNTSKLDLRIS